ncbi:MAG: bis(5'-nucleosyl)-tetraphosphatase (symmetrical) YqeK [Lachnospiraceae bacterium]|nr:bis(5'-nucleosyl)-tetraphosphatase (symmetrical) YqeK [Lachnospiraceae bacterium]
MRVCSDKYTDREIREKLRKKLDTGRYEHSLGVAYTACSLFMAHGHGEISDLSRAYTAGILHDCAKCLTDEERDKYIRKYQVELSDTEQMQPFLIHAKLGAVLAKEKYGVTDPEILSAIRWHTTGCAGMSFLEAVIFSADYIEPNRKMLPMYPALRPLLFSDLDRAVCDILRYTIAHLEEKGQLIEEHTLEAYEYYKKLTGAD